MKSDDRSSRGTSRRLLVFGPAMIVLLTGILAYVGLERSQTTRAWVTHTRDVLDASSSLLNALLDGETAERGFLLTGDRAFLPPSRDAAVRADRMLAQLRALTIDNPHQQARLDTLVMSAHAWLAINDSSIADAEGGHAAAAVDVVAHGQGRATMTDVRRLIAGVDAEEDHLLLIREANERRAANFTSVLLVVGTLIAALLAFFVNRNLDRALRERREALTAVEATNEQLQEQAVELEVQADASQAAALEAELATERAEGAMHAAEASERRAERLQRATEAFSGALALDEVASLIVDQAMSALDAASGLLASLDASGESLRFVTIRNIDGVAPGGTISIDGDQPLCVAARTGRPVLRSEQSARSAAAFPLEYNGRVLGALLIRFDHSLNLASADVALLTAFSRIAAESFERARLFDAERVARTAAEGANRAKAAFLASMSHELRTPLQAALGFAQLVRSGVYGDVNAQQAEVLGRVERSQMHLARLIDDILDFARIEAGRVRIAVEPVVIAEVFAEVTPLVEPQALSKQVELRVDAAPRELVAKADRHRLRQIMVNLVGNAIKFTPSRGTIRVSATRTGEVAAIRVADTGPGIPADRLQAVFEPFVQVDNALTRAHEGAGLGLAISRDLARAMGGDLTVETEVGRGATFVVTLPM